MTKPPDLETRLVHYKEYRQQSKGAVVAPIYQNSLFTFEDWEAIDTAFDDRDNSNIYTRVRNPTVHQVEEKLAMLAGAERARLFGSGIGAVTAAMVHFLEPGDHVIAVKNCYGPTNNLLNRFLRTKMHIDTTFVAGEQVSDFEEAINERTKVIYLESPSSAIFTLQNISAVSELAKSRGIKTLIDNSWATPIFQQPLKMGVDLEIHSCSKYLGGHSDIIAGVVMGSDKDILEMCENSYEFFGAKMAPFEAFLLQRSLRTLPMRLKQHQENAMLVAEFLQTHTAIKQVRYPGLPGFPQAELAKKQMTGYSGLMSFELKTQQLRKIKRFFNSLQYFQIGVSWGGHESLVYAPAISYLKELPAEQFAALGISLGDIRISVGLESAKDLIADLSQALKEI
ncbi:MAG: trans-sulfuration enzyme family protein [Calditrichia bacterium]